MPRSFGGGRGVSSSAYSGSNRTKDAATLIGLSRSGKNLECIPITDSRSCQIMFDLYEETQVSETRFDQSRSWRKNSRGKQLNKVFPVGGST